MTTEKLSLADRLKRLGDGQAAHPEYDAIVVRKMAYMPIDTYLGTYEAFCNLQNVLGIKMRLPYQIVARIIANRYQYKEITPEELVEVVNILAHPLVQIQRAYHDQNPALVPRRDPGRTVVRWESLGQRLANASTLTGAPQPFYNLPAKRFFNAVAELTGNPGFADVYQQRILPHVPDEHALLREVVYEINALEHPKRAATLYTILIQPFAVLSEADMEREAI